MKKYYSTIVQELGTQVHAFKGARMLILFNENAPQELREYCVLHRGNKLEDTVEPGDISGSARRTTRSSTSAARSRRTCATSATSRCASMPMKKERIWRAASTSRTKRSATSSRVRRLPSISPECPGKVRQEQVKQDKKTSKIGEIVMASWLNLEGKTAVVTGGASGIGKTVVQSFLDNGANVVVCDMNPKEPEFERGEGSGDVLYVVTDVTKADSVRAMVEKAKASSASSTSSSTTPASTSRACSSTPRTRTASTSSMSVSTTRSRMSTSAASISWRRPSAMNSSRTARASSST